MLVKITTLFSCILRVYLIFLTIITLFDHPTHSSLKTCCLEYKRFTPQFENKSMYNVNIVNVDRAPRASSIIRLCLCVK